MAVIVDRILSVCSSGGVEIHGLHATIAPRRQVSQTPPTLEQFQFVPYIQEYPANPDSLQYTHAVLGLIKHGIQGLFNNGLKENIPNTTLLKQGLKEVESEMSNIDNYRNFQTAENKHSLLHMLDEVFTLEHNDDFFSNVSQLMKGYRGKLQYDMLLTSHLKTEMLKPALDVVLENSKSVRKLKIAEIVTDTSIYSSVIPLLNTQPMLNIDYSIIGLGLDMYDTSELQNLHIETLPWDFLTSPSTAPSQLNSLDLIILNNTLHQHYDIPAILAQIQSMLKPGGFLYICEPTRNLIVPLILEFLDREIPPHEDKTFGPFYSEEKWEKCLQSNNFSIAQKNSDSLLTSAFLCR